MTGGPVDTRAPEPAKLTETGRGGGAAQPASRLTRQQKAAVIIGVLGIDAAGPVLENLDETSLRQFTHAMSNLRRLDADHVRATIAEFLGALDAFDSELRGGLSKARGLLEQHVAEGLLARILDEADTPSADNVWQKVTKIDDDALAGFLNREHPQTAAVVLSKFSAEHAARILDRLEPDRARDVVVGISRAANLDDAVIAAIGDTMSRDLLAAHAEPGSKHDPADQVGAIMNYTSAAVRDHILASIDAEQPDFAGQIRRKMFTFEDIPVRVPTRGVAAIVRSVDQAVLLRALFSTRESLPQAGEFFLSNISSRMSDQLRDELGEITSVRRRDGERAQAEVIGIIRQLVERGEIELNEEDE